MTTTYDATPPPVADAALPPVEDPRNGLQFHELSQVFGHGSPFHPGLGEALFHRQANHAEMGVLSHRIKTVMHNGTHVNAPHHLIQGGAGVGEIPLNQLFGPGLVVDVPKRRWEAVTVADLEAAPIQAGDIIVIVTGWHLKYAESQEYFADAPGLSAEAARYLIDAGVKAVGIDTANIDIPLATSLGLQRGGPAAKYLPKRYMDATGRDPREDFPEWNPAHRALLGAGVLTIENVGGQVSQLVGKRVTFHALPWRWPQGDACQIRFVAITDPSGTYRIGGGAQ